MIRLIREGSPWVIKAVILIIAVTFVIGMGWYGYEASQPNAIATVGPYTVTKQEYLRAKQRFYQFYREQLKQEEVKDETLQQLAIESLITNKLWLVLADEFGLSVSELELHDAIVNQKDFQKDGVFDPVYYQRLLAANRMKPNEYEKQRRTELLIEKARLLVSEATALTPAELQEVKDLHARQSLEGAEPDMNMFEQIKMQFVIQKKQRAMQAAQAALRARSDTTIHQELL
ncbi:MAG: SurA N-terminal domain-containing protein [Nitrospirales bacterium]